jgi:hypothetical protein
MDIAATSILKTDSESSSKITIGDVITKMFANSDQAW